MVTDGCIVLSRIHDVFTLKRVRKKGSRVSLIPEVGGRRPIDVRQEDMAGLSSEDRGRMQLYVPIKELPGHWLCIGRRFVRLVRRPRDCDGIIQVESDPASLGRS